MKLLKNKYSSFNNSIIKVVTNLGFDNEFFVPQGICSYEDYFFISFYDSSNKNNSMIYIYDNSNLYKKVILDSKIHCGGICINDKFKKLYITGKGKDSNSYINEYNYKDVFSCKEILQPYDTFRVDIDNRLYSTSAKHSSPSFMTYFDNSIYVGNYCDCVDLDKAIIKKYNVNKDGKINNTYEIIANPFSNTQGLCVIKKNNERYYIFSRSFGRKRNSLIHVCKLVNGYFKIISTMVLPSMLEQICEYNGNILVLFESSSKKYRNSSLTVNDEVFLLDFDKVLKSNDTYNDFCKGTSIFVRNSDYKF